MHSLLFVRIGDASVEISPFEVETHATVFEDSPVALISAEAATQTRLNALAEFLSSLKSIDLKLIRNYLLNSGLMVEYQNNKLDCQPYKAIAIKFTM